MDFFLEKTEPCAIASKGLLWRVQKRQKPQQPAAGTVSQAMLTQVTMASSLWKSLHISGCSFKQILYKMYTFDFSQRDNSFL